VIVDARGFDAAGPVECDVCIVGGGPAGITLALELANRGRSVCLLESGGLGHERGSQALLDGEVAGGAYPKLIETRSAMLGGATGVWAGWCRPLDAVDFEPRGWVADGGWPFPHGELLACVPRAHELCGLGPADYDAAAWEARTGLARLPLADPGLEPAMFHARAWRFGTEHRPALQRGPGIRVLLHATALALERGDGGARIARVRAGTLNGRRFDVVGRIVVLAAGGIENARILLLSGESPEQAVGNDHGLVGRYFMEHGFVNAGSFVPRDPDLSLAFHFPVAGGGGPAVRAVLALAAAAQRERRLLNGAIFFHPAYEAHEVFDSPEVQAMLEIGNKLRGRAVPGGIGRRVATALGAPGKLLTAIRRKLAARGGPQPRWRTRALFECAPRRDNRVTLARDKDAFGRPLARLEWRAADADIASCRAMHALFDASLRQAGLGHFEARFPDDVGAWRAAIEGGKHHMGTTRMHADPRRGVTDADARVHGLSNLYVAGSSVFPTGGYANPTLTLVALAVRLVRHLDEVLRQVQ